MPRSARRISSSSVYHVVVRGSSRQIIFENDADRSFYLKRVSKLLAEINAQLYAWCLMDNHVHMLLCIEHDALRVFMHKLLTGYAGYFNRVHGRTGPLFEGRYKSEPVESDEYLLAAVRYIHQNPMKAGLTDNLSYPWSSYNDYFDHGKGLTQTSLILDVFGGVSAFKHFHTKDNTGKFSFLDVGPYQKKRVADADALEIAKSALDTGDPADIKAMPRVQRDTAICRLKAMGLSVRQIQRLTGVAIAVISRASE